jgi:hypothetical protein
MSGIGTCACDTTELHPVSECVRPGTPSDEVVHEDVRAMVKALGLGEHARPYSAHAVVHREVLPALERLRDFAVSMINAPDDSAADWGYDLAHLLGMLDIERPRECTCLPAGPTCDPCEAWALADEDQGATLAPTGHTEEGAGR